LVTYPWARTAVTPHSTARRRLLAGLPSRVGLTAEPAQARALTPVVRAPPNQWFLARPPPASV